MEEDLHAMKWTRDLIVKYSTKNEKLSNTRRRGHRIWDTEFGTRFGRRILFHVSSWIFDGLKKELGAQIRTDGRESQTEQAHQL